MQHGAASAQGAGGTSSGREALLPGCAGGAADMDADAVQDTRSRGAVSDFGAGVARLDAQLGVGTNVARPLAGRGRGPVIPPQHWLEEQRARTQPGGQAAPDDHALRQRFNALSVQQRREIKAAAPTKRVHGNAGSEQLRKAARTQGLGLAAGERVDVLFQAAGGAAGGAAAGRGAAVSRYSLRPAAAQALPSEEEEEADPAPARLGGAGAGARARSGAAFVGARVAVPFQLGATTVFMQGDVLRAEGGSYVVRYVDTDELLLPKAGVLVGVAAYAAHSSRTDGTFIGSYADAERAYAAAGGEAPAQPAAEAVPTSPAAPAAGAAQARGRAARQDGPRGTRPGVTKRQLNTAEALRRLADRGGQPFVPAAPPRGAAPRRASRDDDGSDEEHADEDEPDADEPASRCPAAIQEFAHACAQRFKAGGEIKYTPCTPGVCAEVNPSAWQLQDVFLIDQWATFRHIIGDRPACPRCNSAACVERQGWSNKGPRRVMDTHNCVWVWAKVFRCTSCPSRRNPDKTGYTFQSIDVRLMQQIALDHPFIARSYPFTFTHKQAVTGAVMQDLRHALGTSMSFEALAGKYREQHHIKYTEARMGYAQHALTMRKLGASTVAAVLAGTHRDVPAFGDFSDPAGYAGKSPTAQYLIALALVVHSRLHRFLTTRNMMILGEYLRGDNSFKLAKKIMSDSTHPFLCVYTAVNEFNEVVGSWCCRTSSLEQVKTALEAVSRRYTLWPRLAREELERAAAALPTATAAQAALAAAAADAAAATATGAGDPAVTAGAAHVATAAPQEMEHDATTGATAASNAAAAAASAAAVMTAMASSTAGNATGAAGTTTTPLAAAADGVAAAARTSPSPAGWVRHFLGYNVCGPSLWWTDNCCKEREFLMGIFATLKGECVYKPSDFTPAGLQPMEALYSLVDTVALCDAACAALSNSTALGFDVEWPVSRADGSNLRGLVATIQLANNTHAYVFQLRKLVVNGALPASLAAILANSGIKKVGVGPSADATRLLQDYQVSTDGVIDLAVLAREKQLDMLGSCSLAALAARILRIHLPKPAEIVVSAWGALTLSEEQIKYAGHDAAVGIRAYTALVDGTVAEAPATPAATDMSLEDLEIELKRLLSIVEPAGAASDGSAGAAASQAARTAAALRSAVLPDAAGASDSQAAPSADADAESAPASIARFCSVLLDVLHLMQRYEKGCSQTTDPLFGLFMRKLKESIFVKNSDDMELLKRWLLDTRGMTADEVARMPSSYIHQRVRRHIPPPAELALRVIRAVNMFAGLNCADGTPFFREDVRKPGKKVKNGMMSIHKEQLAHILKGCVSDKPGQSMYIRLPARGAGDPEAALPRYKCIRATSQGEGYHFHFYHGIKGWTLSPELMSAKLTHFRDRWNQNAGQTYRGLPDFGHYNMELVDELQRAELALHGTDSFPGHIATPHVPDELLESFDTARRLDIDLPGVERLRAVHAARAAPEAADDNGAASALLVLSSEEPECSPAQLDTEIRRAAAANAAAARSSVATRRVAAGVWLAQQQCNITNVTAVTTKEEVSLFTDLLMNRGFLPPAGSKRQVDWVKLCEAFNTAVYDAITAKEQDCGTCGPLAGGRSSAVSCVACRSSCGLSLKTPEVLKEYYELLGRRLAAAAAMEPDLLEWQALQRAHNSPADPARFAVPLVPPPAPPQAAADAVHGAGLELLPQHQGAALEGLQPAPRRRETDKEAVARWRDAAVRELSDSQANVQAADVRGVMERMQSDEASAVELPLRRTHLAALRKHLQRLGEAAP